MVEISTFVGKVTIACPWLTYPCHRCRQQKSFQKIRWPGAESSLQNCQKEPASSSQSEERKWVQELEIRSTSDLKKTMQFVTLLSSDRIWGKFDFELINGTRRKLPLITSLGQLLGSNLRSSRGAITPSMLPNIVERPRQKSMMKKRTDQRGENGISMMASVKTMKASPVPSTP